MTTYGPRHALPRAGAANPPSNHVQPSSNHGWTQFHPHI